MRNTQTSNSTQVANTAAAAWYEAALSANATVKREDVRPGIFYWAVNTASLAGEPELLSSQEAKAAGEEVALFMFEAKARAFQKKELKAKRQH